MRTEKVPKYTVSTEDPIGLSERLLKLFDNGESVNTSHSATVNIGGAKVFLSPKKSNLPAVILSRKVRKHVEDRGVWSDDDGKGILYYSMTGTKAVQRYPETCIVDISSAYPHCALRLGIIDDTMFYELMKAAKAVRLPALGALATRKVYKERTNGVTHAVREVRAQTAGLFFAIARKVGEVMDKATKATGCEPCWWVDGAFVSAEKAPEFSGHLEKEGWPTKTTGIEFFAYNPEQGVIKWRENGENRYMPVPQPVRYSKEIREGLTLALEKLGK